MIVLDVLSAWRVGYVTDSEALNALQREGLMPEIMMKLIDAAYPIKSDDSNDERSDAK